MIFQKEKIEAVCYQNIKEIWDNSSDCFPDFLVPVTGEDRERNEQFIIHKITQLKKLLRSYHNPLTLKYLWKKKWNNLIDTLLFREPILGIAGTFSEETLNDMKREFEHFFRMASSFDKQMDLSEIGQAARNYLVYDVFTEIHNLPHTVTPAIFGYSMLYPYTDNFIDDTALTAEQKKRYNQLIDDQIMGRTVNAVTEHDKKTCELISDVIDFYETEQKEDIKNGLFLMLDAQKLSLSQTKTADRNFLSIEEIFRISSYKGGISVLIDRFYVPKEVNDADFIFYLSYGFFLQLADDLQDISGDRKNLHQTLFNCKSMQNAEEPLNHEYIEKTLNRLFHYLKTMMDSYTFQNPVLKEFITDNCYLLLMYSAFLSEDNFSTEYLEQLKPYLPLSIQTVRMLQTELEPIMKNADLKAIIAETMNSK